MANSPESETTELVKQLLERLAISTAREDQAVAISTLQTQGSETRAAVESLKADHDESTVQQSFLKDQTDKRFNEVFTQLAAIQTLNEKIAELSREKEELIAIVSTVKNDMQKLQLQVAAQDALRVYNRNFLDSAAASPKISSQQGEQFEYDENTMLTDLNAAMKPEVSPSDPDVSMTLTDFQMPATSLHAPRQHATPEYMMPPPSFSTPKNLAPYGVATPGSVNTMMPDTVGFNRYDGPFQLPHRSLFAESSDDRDENVDKRPKRTRRHSVAPLEGLALSPINEDNEQPDVEPITGVDKTLWRENWEQGGRPGTLEDYARKQKAAMLFSDITSGTERPRKRYTASDFDKLPAPQENKRKRARHQPNTAQPLAAADSTASQLSATNSMPPPSSFQTGRPSRAWKIPGRFGGKDILTGKAFLGATNSRGALPPSQARNDTASAPQKSIRFDGDDNEQPEVPGNAASSLLLQFGSRKTKISKKAAK